MQSSCAGAHRRNDGLCWFNDWLGFGKSDCARRGNCGDAVAEAFAAVIAGFASDGGSEEETATKVEAEIATLAKKWSKGSFEKPEDSLAYHADAFVAILQGFARIRDAD